MAFLNTALDLMLVLVGFGLIIFVHELGHFVAARWAGIRVLAFAIGFGPPLLTYRKGLGVRRGSTEREYLERERATLPPASSGLSPTEYRFNALPFGGYVKMLGQDDLDPSARSSASDSYQACPPWKKLVVISAGVVMNLISAAILFIIVFMIGRQVDAPVIGAVASGSPAAQATPAPGWESLGPGLRAGDTVLAIDDDPVRAFDDIVLATGMARRDDILTFRVQRPGVEGTPSFTLTPKEHRFSGGLLEAGIAPSRSGTLSVDPDAVGSAHIAKKAQGLRKGMRIEQVGGRPASTWLDVQQALQASGGEPFDVTHHDPASDERVTKSISPQPMIESGFAAVREDEYFATSHLRGLTGVAVIESVEKGGQGKGLEDGDILVRVGSVEFPQPREMMREVRSRKGKSIAMTVLRREGTNADAPWREVELPEVAVSSRGQIGVNLTNTLDAPDAPVLLASPVDMIFDGTGNEVALPASGLGVSPGMRVIEVQGTPVTTMRDFWLAMKSAAGTDDRSARLVVQRPAPAGQEGPRETIAWTLTDADAQAILALGWASSLPEQIFGPAQVALKASNPVGALRMGLAETKRVMLMTYLTFARLFQGTVKIEHLKGPVGIAHLGTLVADRGFIWLLFFFALISVNLAVINFLPLPIVDGGQALFIIYEWILGKPVPVGFQNAVTLAGLVLIGGMFLLVTFNDIRNLLGV